MLARKLDAVAQFYFLYLSVSLRHAITCKAMSLGIGFAMKCDRLVNKLGYGLQAIFKQFLCVYIFWEKIIQIFFTFLCFECLNSELEGYNKGVGKGKAV